MSSESIMTEQVVGDEEQTKAALLNLLAEGKPFVFLTVEIQGEFIVTNTLTPMAHDESGLLTMEHMLESALEQVRSKLSK